MVIYQILPYNHTHTTYNSNNSYNSNNFKNTVASKE